MGDSSADMKAARKQVCENNLDAIAKEKFASITKCMEDLGVDAALEQEWYDVILRTITENWQDLEDNAQKQLSNVAADMETLLKKVESYCKKLRIPMEPYGSKALPLIDERRIIKQDLAKYEAIYEKKNEDIQKLRNRQTMLCKILGETPKNLDCAIIPTKQELDDFTDHLETLEAIRFEREATFINQSDEIGQIMKDFQIVPRTKFEETITAASLDSHTLNADFMKQLELFHQWVKNESNVISEKIQQLRLKVRSLWDMLSEDIQQCDAFLLRHPGNSVSTFNAFTEEVQRCEELRKANIGKFIEKIRTEILALWQKCHYTDEQKQEFTYFESDFYNEDMLELHDRELVKLKHFYNENQNLFTMLDDYKQMWSKCKELEAKAQAPDRFHNRGGKLLQEERERNKVSRAILKLQTLLVTMAETFQKVHNRPFTSWGQTVDEVIDEHFAERENDKKLKLSARKQKKTTTSMRLTPRSASATKLTLPAITPPLQLLSAKRRLHSPKIVSTSKRPRVVVNKKRYSGNNQINGAMIQNLITSRSNKKRRRTRNSHSRSQNEENFYAEFSNDLNHPGLRSTMFSAENCSQNVLAVPLPKTPSVQTATIKSPGHTPFSRTTSKLSSVQTSKKLNF